MPLLTDVLRLNDSILDGNRIAASTNAPYRWTLGGPELGTEAGSVHEIGVNLVDKEGAVVSAKPVHIRLLLDHLELPRLLPGGAVLFFYTMVPGQKAVVNKDAGALRWWDY